MELSLTIQSNGKEAFTRIRATGMKSFAKSLACIAGQPANARLEHPGTAFHCCHPVTHAKLKGLLSTQDVLPFAFYPSLRRALVLTVVVSWLGGASVHALSGVCASPQCALLLPSAPLQPQRLIVITTSCVLPLELEECRMYKRKHTCSGTMNSESQARRNEAQAFVY